ncbi:MAG TPA: GspH/FimT family pseudopilin [Steroidobacteraceae bacterium]|jgi:type IV fimbrial biogenesis protein FimT|nr:GspH/FimT family pseudopilin [Steroidobacteraceae bacterium]
MKNRSQGMTLIELLTAMLVVAILMGLAVPSFREFTQNNRTIAATNELVTALNLARSEALRRATTTVVCASSNQQTCSGSTTWTTGWIAFNDANSNGVVDANELLQAWSGVNGGLVASATQDRAAYNAMGMAQLAGNITFRVGAPTCTGLHVGQTVISTIGSVRSTKVACPP